jgi:hypothetical protein
MEGIAIVLYSYSTGIKYAAKRSQEMLSQEIFTKTL